MKQYLTKVSTIKQKKTLRIVVNNLPILLAYFEEKIYAIRDKCPHMGATLSRGIYKDGVITCKDHGLPISVITGAVTDQSKADFLNLEEYSRTVRTYKVIVESDSVYIDI